jgi:hypothetical protein
MSSSKIIDFVLRFHPDDGNSSKHRSDPDLAASI